jgi:hypothetical protein
MREIKFRAWDGKRYTTDFFITSEGTVFKPHYDRDAEIVSGFTIEQFTGLHDKNDKEIYEGDIVVTDYGTGPVEYSGAGFSVDCDSISEYWETSQSIEVIGNIHENPELLND